MNSGKTFCQTSIDKASYRGQNISTVQGIGIMHISRGSVYLTVQIFVFYFLLFFYFIMYAHWFLQDHGTSQLAQWKFMVTVEVSNKAAGDQWNETRLSPHHRFQYTLTALSRPPPAFLQGIHRSLAKVFPGFLATNSSSLGTFHPIHFRREYGVSTSAIAFTWQLQYAVFERNRNPLQAVHV